MRSCKPQKRLALQLQPARGLGELTVQLVQPSTPDFFMHSTSGVFLFPAALRWYGYASHKSAKGTKPCRRTTEEPVYRGGLGVPVLRVFLKRTRPPRAHKRRLLKAACDPRGSFDWRTRITLYSSPMRRMCCGRLTPFLTPFQNNPPYDTDGEFLKANPRRRLCLPIRGTTREPCA